MIGVEDPVHADLAAPPQPASGVRFEHGRLQRERPTALWLHPEGESRTHLGAAHGVDDERIPVAVRGEVGQDAPHLRRRGIDVHMTYELLAHEALLGCAGW